MRNDEDDNAGFDDEYRCRMTGIYNVIRTRKINTTME